MFEGHYLLGQMLSSLAQAPGVLFADRLASLRPSTFSPRRSRRFGALAPVKKNWGWLGLLAMLAQLGYVGKRPNP